MYYRGVFILGVLMFAHCVKLKDEVKKLNSSGNHELSLSKIDSRLNVASKMLESAREELKKVIKQSDKDDSLKEEALDCAKWKRSYYDEKPMDCGDIYNDGRYKSGIYRIWPQSKTSTDPLLVYCDMEDGGGWTVIQRRADFGNDPFYFYLGWDAYKSGFGHLQREFWIGNDNLFALTNQRSYQLKVEVTDWKQSHKYATYQEFWIDDEIHNYTLQVKGYNGTAGDSMKRQNGEPFSTKDRDNDKHPEESCAQTFIGAWWYSACMDSNLNGVNLGTWLSVYGKGILWSTFRGFSYSHKEAVMKIRSVDFGDNIAN